MQLLDWTIDPEFPSEGVVSKPPGYNVYPVAPDRWRAVWVDGKGFPRPLSKVSFGSKAEAVAACDKHFKNNSR